MKILVTGILTFSIWTVLSTYIYVCKIKGLCYEPQTVFMAAVDNKAVIPDKPEPKPVVSEPLVIPETLVIYFAFDKSEVRSNAESDRYFKESNAYLEKNQQARLSITGHTDAIGSGKYNQALGYRRAQRTQQYFESKGINAGKIIIESKGEKVPAGDNNTESGRANNRRTVITINK